MSDTTPNPLDGLLSEFALGPAWARAKSEPVEKKFKESAEREYQPRGRRDDRQGGDRGRDNNRNDRGGDRRQGGSGGERRGGGANRRDDGRNSRGRPDFRNEEFAPAEGVTVNLIPEKAAIQLVCKEVHQVARVYPLFDIAQIILAERARSRAVFEISDKKDPFYRCKVEEALYLTKEEALRHLLAADWRSRYIEESTIEIDPPKGNFQSVAKCGISGVWLGPPNYHAYQTELRRLHRELFSSMPFEVYSAKVRIERSQEAVNAWLDSMKNQTRWRILTDEEISAAGIAASQPATINSEEAITPTEESETTDIPEDSESPSAETVAEEPEKVTPSEEPTSEDPISEEAVEPTAEEEQTETPAEATPEQEIKWFTDRAEFERALANEVLEKTFHITRKAKLSAGIVGKNLSPGLLARLKASGNHARKHPAVMIPLICKILEAEHMPVFKRKGKLFTGPARPHALAADAVLAPRPAQMVTWIRENTPAKLEGLWKSVLPEGASAPPAEYAADLFWLLQQGHILLYTDDVLVVQEVPKPQEPKKPKQPKKKVAKAVSSDSEAPAELPQDPTSEIDVPPTETVEPAKETTETTELTKEIAEPSETTDEPTDEPIEKPSEPVEIIAEAAEVAEEPVEAITDAPPESIDSTIPAAAPESPTPEAETPEEAPEETPLP